jgi:hypothetical protein
MPLLARFANGIQNVFRRRRIERELEDELDSGAKGRWRESDGRAEGSLAVS